jgi:thiol-disulfide isomerase/thioredoxin
MKILFFISILIIASGLQCFAQPDPDYERIVKQFPYENLKVGEPCPNFVLTNVHYYKSKHVTLADLKGKQVILDFFNSGCTGCFKSMPKVSKLKEKFGQNIEFFFVGLFDSKVEKVYEKYRKAFDLKVPVVYDSILPWRFLNFGYPTQIWIDPNGIIQAITGSEDLNENNISAFLAGSPFKFADRTKIKDGEINNPFIDSVAGVFRYKVDEDTSFLYKFEFGEWQDEKYGASANLRENGLVTKGPNAGKAIEIRGPLRDLYFQAYFGVFGIFPWDSVNYGNVYKVPILEGIDSNTFVSRYSSNYWYRLIDRRRDKTEDLFTAMKSDLHRHFGYEAKLEERIMPYYKLVLTDKSKAQLLRSKGGKPISQRGVAGFKEFNAPWKNVVMAIQYYGAITTEPTILDETGIDYNVDIEIEAAMQSFEDVNRALRKYGIGLVNGEKMMKVLVVRNPRRL